MYGARERHHFLNRRYVLNQSHNRPAIEITLKGRREARSLIPIHRSFLNKLAPYKIRELALTQEPILR
jgi:hypothetical protein